MSRPSNTIRPSSAFRLPAIRLRTVVLPAPFGPTIPSASPGPSARLTPRTARTEPNDFETSWSSTRAGKLGRLVRDRDQLRVLLQAGHALVADHDELVLVLLALDPLGAGELTCRGGTGSTR